MRDSDVIRNKTDLHSIEYMINMLSSTGPQQVPTVLVERPAGLDKAMMTFWA